MISTEYGKLEECWIGRSYDPNSVEDSFVKDILYETEEDLQILSNILTSCRVYVKRPDYDYSHVDIKQKPQLLHARDHLQVIGGKLYVGPRYENYIKDWVELNENRLPVVTLDNLCAPSIIRADRVVFDAVAIEPKRYDWFKSGNPNVPFVFKRLSCREKNIERHSDGVLCVVKEGVVIATHQARNLEEVFPNWDILYLEENTNELGKMNKSKKDIVWSPDHIPSEYKEWVGYSPETFFDVNCLQLDSKHLFVTRYNKVVFDFLKKHNVEPIIIPFRHRYLWDGGLHCMTFDYKRT